MCGKTFGLLLVIAEDGRDEWGQVRWRCRCQCGALHLVVGGKLRRGEVKSCGCAKSGWCRSANLTHGAAQRGKLTPEYRVWSNMIDRCERVTNERFERYGGRGISVCARWRESFANFLADVGLRPSSEHTLDRKNNDGNYEPKNVRWATRTEQNQNKRNNINLTWNGETHCLREWARRMKIGYLTLYNRHRSGWSTEQTLTTPVRSSNRCPRERVRQIETVAVRKLRRNPETAALMKAYDARSKAATRAIDLRAKPPAP